MFYIDNNEDEVQSTQETMLLDNYEEEDKVQGATQKPEDTK